MGIVSLGLRYDIKYFNHTPVYLVKHLALDLEISFQLMQIPEATVLAKRIGFLSPTWETWIELLAPSFSLAKNQPLQTFESKL